MSLSILQWIHVSGLTLIAIALGAFLPYARLSKDHQASLRRPLAAAHGLGLLLLLVSGFGLLHAQGFSMTSELWVWIKITIWLALGGSLAVLRRSDASSAPGRIAAVVFLILSAALLGLHHTQLFS